MKGMDHNLFFLGCACCVPMAVSSLAGWRWLRNLFYFAATALVLFSAAARFHYHWPLMCLFQEPYLISLFLLLLAGWLFVRADKNLAIAAGAIAVAISFYTLLFPGDIYVSFVKTNSIFAHFFSLCSSFARAAYLCAGALSIARLLPRTADSGDMSRRPAQSLVKNVIIAGFAFHTVGMFLGGVWAYCGWGMPLQWQSDLLLGMAGVWFYYACWLHLHLVGDFGRNAMLYAASAGGILTFIFSFLPDTGAFSFQGIVP